MPLQMIVGVPGAGKTAHVIRLVEGLRQAQKPVYLFLARDAGILEASQSNLQHGVIASRDSLSSAYDHFETTSDTLAILQRFLGGEPATLVFEEAQCFLPEILPAWVTLSEHGHNVVISTPSLDQRAFLEKNGGQVTTLLARCNLFADGEATQFFILPETNTTLSVCDACAELLRERAATAISSMLVQNEPHRGEKRVYQPIEIDHPKFADLVPVRNDSPIRAQVMADFVKTYLPSFEHRSKSYLDVGCNTGFFCRRMAQLGFVARGLDIVEETIAIARLLDTYFYRQYSDLFAADAIDFLLTDEQSYDVTASLSMFQWLYLQAGTEIVDRALERLFAKTRTLAFFEIEYSSEAHLVDRLGQVIDRDWVLGRMNGSGLFSEVVIADVKGLKRDFFVGIRKGASPSP